MGYVFEPRGACGYSQQKRPVPSCINTLRNVPPPRWLLCGMPALSCTYGCQSVVVESFPIDTDNETPLFEISMFGACIPAPLNVVDTSPADNFTSPDVIFVDHVLERNAFDILIPPVGDKAIRSVEFEDHSADSQLIPSATRFLFSILNPPTLATSTFNAFALISDVLINPPCMIVSLSRASFKYLFFAHEGKAFTASLAFSAAVRKLFTSLLVRFSSWFRLLTLSFVVSNVALVLSVFCLYALKTALPSRLRFCASSESVLGVCVM